jgi:rfaE bifunctional protein nucleotidyltransferase chain/domain
MNNKIKSLREALKVVKSLKSKGKKVVFTNGCFDILHYGHVSYLQKARRLGDFLVIGLNSDKSVKRLKGKDRPINTQKDRANILSALECVDLVVIFEQDTPIHLIQAFSPDILVKGGDWDAETIVGANFVRSQGGKVSVIKYIKGYSTTRTIAKLSGCRK